MRKKNRMNIREITLIISDRINKKNKFQLKSSLFN